ncbi:MAG TPA: hypothetical protein VE397_09985 [Stellaceae bacterium]|jgi:hypothetical protein|nr:hypothetical protein [Stellaceae bacterium]
MTGVPAELGRGNVRVTWTCRDTFVEVELIRGDRDLAVGLIMTLPALCQFCGGNHCRLTVAAPAAAKAFAHLRSHAANRSQPPEELA